MANLGSLNFNTGGVAADGYSRLFVTPLNRPALVSMIIIGNPTAGDVLISMGIVQDGSEDIANGTKWFEDLTLPARDTLPFRGPFTFAPGDDVRVKADTNNVTFYAVGNLRT